jgi:similar to spore coat protein
LITEKRIAPHETFELHELLTFKSVSATKSKAMAGLVTDDELKTILQEDFTLSQVQIKELRGLLKLSVFSPIEASETLVDVATIASH